MDARNKYANEIAARVVKEHGKSHLGEFRPLGVMNYLQLHTVIKSVLLDSKTKMLLGNQGETLFYNADKNIFICHNRTGKNSTCFIPSDKKHFSNTELSRVTKDAATFRLNRAVQIEKIDFENAALFHKRNDRKFAKLIAQKTAEQKKAKNKLKREKSKIARRINNIKTAEKPAKAWRREQVALKQSITGVKQQGKVIDQAAKSMAAAHKDKLKRSMPSDNLSGDKKWQKFVNNKTVQDKVAKEKHSEKSNVDNKKSLDDKRKMETLDKKKWQDLMFRQNARVTIDKRDTKFKH